ncbi:MAG: prohibitin family protein [Synechococcales cyanobacterium]
MTGSSGHSPSKVAWKWLPLVGVGIVGILVTFRPFLYVTPPGHATVVFNSFRGLQQDRIEPPGMTWLTPGLDRPITYNVLTRVWRFSDEPNVPMLASNAVSVNSADGQAFSIDVYVAIKPNVAVLDDLHAEVGENYMNVVIVPLVRSKIRDISAEFDSQDFYQQANRQEIERRSLAAIQQEISTVTVDGQPLPLLMVEGIFLGTPDFPTALTESIEQRQVASITAQTAQVRAQIQNRETERLLILAKANQEAIELKGQAAAQNAALADLLFYEKLLERIEAAKTQQQGSPIRVIRVEGQSTVFLNVDPQKAAVITP